MDGCSFNIVDWHKHNQPFWSNSFCWQFHLWIDQCLVGISNLERYESRYFVISRYGDWNQQIISCIWSIVNVRFDELKQFPSFHSSFSMYLIWFHSRKTVMDHKTNCHQPQAIVQSRSMVVLTSLKHLCLLSKTIWISGILITNGILLDCVFIFIFSCIAMMMQMPPTVLFITADWAKLCGVDIFIASVKSNLFHISPTTFELRIILFFPFKFSSQWSALTFYYPSKIDSIMHLHEQIHVCFTYFYIFAHDVSIVIFQQIWTLVKIARWQYWQISRPLLWFLSFLFFTIHFIVVVVVLHVITSVEANVHWILQWPKPKSERKGVLGPKHYMICSLWYFSLLAMLCWINSDPFIFVISIHFCFCFMKGETSGKRLKHDTKKIKKNMKRVGGRE